MTATNLNPTTANPQPRKTYPQDWPAYNAAQTSEKDTFMVLLADLCANIPQPEYSRLRGKSKWLRLSIRCVPW